MTLLSFTVRNHKSIRDKVTLDLVRPSLRTLVPKDGDWAAVAYPLAGIFGGNATGKSALLDAIEYMFAAVENSATTWQGSRSMRRAPFRLDGTERTSSSSYELDFVHDGRRHLYQFEVDTDGIVGESLREVATSKWRVLFDRRRGSTIKRHARYRDLPDVTERELVLSRARLLPSSRLHVLATDLVANFDVVAPNDEHRERRLSELIAALGEGTITFLDLQALLQAADIGVAAVGIEEEAVPSDLLGLQQAIRTFVRSLREVRGDRDGQSDENSSDEKLDDDELEKVVPHLAFTHRGTVDECPPFSIGDESDGTIAWLAVAVPALEALRTGGLLIADEIDASLHPHLLELLLNAFADPEINTKQAQLIFTSHDAHVLSPLSDVELEPEQVWFTDKTYEGVTELSCLADFPRHPDANVAKRYLTGRYGGTPRLAPSVLTALVTTVAE